MLGWFYAASSRTPSFARVAIPQARSDNQTKVINGGRGLTLYGRHPRDLVR